MFEQRQGNVSITLDHIQSLRLDAGSFSNLNESSLDITITNIDGDCIIFGNAITSSSLSTNMTLEHITEGIFHSGAFATTLGRLSLRNVTMSVPCENNTFAGQIGELSLTSVNLTSVDSGCFLANKKWESLEVRSSHLGEIKEHGLLGSIEDIRIDQSSFGRIHPNGFDLDVTNFSINASSVQILSKHALNVLASGRIMIQKTNITELRKGAFHRLYSSESIHGITLSELAVSDAVNGSLRVPDVKSLTLRELRIRVPCKCSIQEQVAQLFSALSTSSEREAGLFQHAYENIRCVHNNTASSLRDYHCSECHPPMKSICDEENKAAAEQTSADIVDRKAGAEQTPDAVERQAATDQRSSAPAVMSWVPAVVSFVGGVLLSVSIALVAIYHRRCSPCRQRLTYAKRSANGKITVTDLQHPSQELTQSGHRMDSPPALSPPELPESSVHQMGTGSSRADRSTYVSVPDPGEDLDIYEDVSCIPNGEDLYEEIPLFEQTREVEAAAEHDSSQDQPLYAEVNKDKVRNTTCSEIFAHAGDSSGLPVYAQVNKSKITTDQLSGETT